jgi:hypothetical protein
LWRDYGQITRPDAQHTRCSHPLAVIGLKERIASFIAFADAADHAAKKGLRFGLEIEPDPSNTLTANALKVIGVAQSKSWLGKLSAQQWDLGHIWHVAADEIHRDLVAKGVPIAAELYSIHYDKDDPEVKLYILAPKEHSASKRRGRAG